MGIRWVFLLAAIPLLTEYLETGRLPRTPRELITDLVMTLATLVLAAIICRQHRRLVALATTDPLTGLLNRHRFDQDLRREGLRSARLGSPLSLAFLDLDGFKQVNDRLGHRAGDDLLRRVARALQSAIRADVDLLYRVGGDEFCLLLPQVAAADGPAIEARIAAAVDAPGVDLAGVGAGVSIGFVTLAPGEAPEALLRRADELMYAQKEARKAAARAG